jgi:hypothetical protein
MRCTSASQDALAERDLDGRQAQRGADIEGGVAEPVCIAE